ncbi:MAG: hypothetical protein LBL13_12155, partial [Bacteroidales bacterium]|nr:hypothetical protein [Bacteroidales bacterium]
YGIKSKKGVSKSKTYEKYKRLIGNGINEVFAQFFMRVYELIPNGNLATFGTLKYVSSQNFIKLRNHFKAKFKKGFVCKANTFDNVRGNFPISFLIWDMENKQQISEIEVDVYSNDKEIKQLSFSGTKKIFAVEKGKLIIDWLRKYFDKTDRRIGYLRIQGTDVQQNNTIFITNQPSESDFRESKVTDITKNNLIECSIYFSVRKVIPATWLNDRDQFLFPNKQWEDDIEFQNDCLTYTLFNNNISSKNGVNHWIPFPETEINARDKFDSHFMISFLSGKIVKNAYVDLFCQLEIENKKESKTGWKQGQKRAFSPEAQAVFDAGKDLWKYYHAQPKCNVNAGLYDIREHFKGRNNKGKMNQKSDNETYNELIDNLHSVLKILAKKIEPKVYEYDFLKK